MPGDSLLAPPAGEGACGDLQGWQLVKLGLQPAPVHRPPSLLALCPLNHQEPPAHPRPAQAAFHALARPGGGTSACPASSVLWGGGAPWSFLPQ